MKQKGLQLQVIWHPQSKLQLQVIWHPQSNEWIPHVTYSWFYYRTSYVDSAIHLGTIQCFFEMCDPVQSMISYPVLLNILVATYSLMMSVFSLC
jgi:hypothetical protein